MAKFDRVVNKMENYNGYTGNPPSNETEYNAVKDNLFSANAPTWSEIESAISNLPQDENLKASAKAKLIAGEPLTEEEANTIVL